MNKSQRVTIQTYGDSTRWHWFHIIEIAPDRKSAKPISKVRVDVVLPEDINMRRNPMTMVAMTRPIATRLDVFWTPEDGVQFVRCTPSDGLNGPLIENRPVKDREELPGKLTYKGVKNYIRAEVSLLKQGPVPLDVYEGRMQSCGNCDHLVVRDDNRYCAACGCGSNIRADLKVKCHMPEAACPKNHWGTSRGEGIRHLVRVGGAVKQVKEIVRNVYTEARKARKLYDEASATR